MTTIYLAAAEPGSGKTAIALGLLDQASRIARSIGVFRPLVRSREPADNAALDLLLTRVSSPDSLEECLGVTYAEMHEDPDRAMTTILDRFHVLAARHPALLVFGSDFTDVGSPTEFSMNARIAANLGAPMILVVSGHDRTPAQVRTAAANAVDEAHGNHAHILAVIRQEMEELRTTFNDKRRTTIDERSMGRERNGPPEAVSRMRSTPTRSARAPRSSSR